jgi:hypothetical protein
VTSDDPVSANVFTAPGRARLRELAVAALACTGTPGFPFDGQGTPAWGPNIDALLGGAAGEYCAAAHPAMIVALLDHLEPGHERVSSTAGLAALAVGSLISEIPEHPLQMCTSMWEKTDQGWCRPGLAHDRLDQSPTLPVRVHIHARG